MLRLLSFLVVSILAGCAATGAKHILDTLSPWQPVSTSEWVRLERDGTKVSSKIYVTNINNVLFFRWEHPCPNGAKQKNSMVMWRPHEIIANTVQSCHDGSEFAIIAGFNSREFLAGLPEEFVRLFESSPKVPPPIVVEVPKKAEPPLSEV